MKERVYIKAIGDNRHSAGTFRWLKVRGIEKPNNNVYELCVRFQGKDMRTVISKNKRPELEFKIGLWPHTKKIHFDEIIAYWENTNLWQNYNSGEETEHDS